MEFTLSDYELYQRRVSAAVRNFQERNRVSARDLAKTCNMVQGTLYAKLSRRRAWTLQDIITLAQIGVHIPPLPNAFPRRFGIVTRPQTAFWEVR